MCFTGICRIQYRANSAGWDNDDEPDEDYYLNFSTNNGVSLSDVVLVSADPYESDGEWRAGPLEAFYAVDVDIFDVNEVPFSCRNVIFACTDQDNPLYEELLEVSGDASVASFEYGINEAIPHSRGGELLCPGNTIPEGFVKLVEDAPGDDNDNAAYFIGLNNGNGRGTIDSIWRPSEF